MKSPYTIYVNKDRKFGDVSTNAGFYLAKHGYSVQEATRELANEIIKLPYIESVHFGNIVLKKNDKTSDSV